MRRPPQGWKSGRLSDLVERLDSGISIPCQDVPSADGEAGILKLNCVSGGRFDPTASKRANLRDVERLSLFARGERVIISRSNTPLLVGACAFVPKDYPTLFLPDTLWQMEFRAGVEVDARWLTGLLQSKSYRKLLTSIASGTSGSMKKLQKPSLLRIPVPIPTIAEQRKIGLILGTLDREVGTLEMLIAAKLERKRGLMQQLLTGRKRFKEFKGERWRTYRLGELFTERVEIGRTDLPLVAITGQNGVVQRDSLTKRDSSSEDKSKYLRITPGDIGYNTMRMWQGVAGLSKLEGIVSPAYTICVPTRKLDGQFAAYLFKTAPMIHAFHRNSQGLVDDTLSLKFPNFARIHVTIPDVPEQKRIAAVLATCDREIGLLQKQLEALKEQKRGLMQKLLTGEVRVKC